MSAVAWDPEEADSMLLNHDGPWTEEEFLALPPTWWPRIELLDGSLLVTPYAGGRHQLAIFWLTQLIGPAIPPGWLVLPGGNVRITADTFLIPDVIITSQTDPETVFFPGPEIVLAAEVISPGSVGTDRWTKPRRYAQAGVDWYMRVELTGPGAPLVCAYRRDGEDYVEYARAAAGEELRLTEPVAVTFDPAVLLSRRQGAAR